MVKIYSGDNLFLERNRKILLERIFNEEIRHILEGENRSSVKFLDVEIKKIKRRKNRRINSIINPLLFRYVFNKKTEEEPPVLQEIEEVLPVLQKTANKKEIEYETKIYDLLRRGKCPPTEVVRKYAYAGVGNLGALFLEYFGNKKFADFGVISLEGKLINFERLVKKHPESEKTLREKRHSLLTLVASTLADFHYKATTALFVEGKLDQAKNEYSLLDRYNQPWSISKLIVPVAERKFYGYLKGFLKHMWEKNPTLFRDESEFKKYIEKLKGIVGETTEKRRSIFEWAEQEPVGFVHNDLHGGNILIYNGDVRIIDFKRAIVSSVVNDFDFLRSPYYTLPPEERSHVFSTYLSRLIERQNDPLKLNIDLSKVRDNTLNQQDYLRQIYYMFKILYYTAEYSKVDQWRKDHYTNIIDRHLLMLGETLDYITKNDYNIFENYQGVADLRDCLAEKLRDYLLPKIESNRKSPESTIQ